jgi:hypothetical protein
VAVSNLPIFPQAINLGLQSITNGDGTTAKTIFTAGANGSKVETIEVSSTDTVNRDLQLFITRSATNYLLATVQVKVNSGNANNVPSTNILGSTQLPAIATDANGNPTLFLKSGDTLTAAVTTAVTAGKQLAIIANGGDF